MSLWRISFHLNVNSLPIISCPYEIEFWYSLLSLYLFLSVSRPFRFHSVSNACKCKSHRISFLLKVEMNHSQIVYTKLIVFFCQIFCCQNSFTTFQPAFLLLFVWAEHIFGNCSFLFSRLKCFFELTLHLYELAEAFFSFLLIT